MTNNTCRMGVFGMERKLLGITRYESRNKVVCTYARRVKPFTSHHIGSFGSLFFCKQTYLLIDLNKTIPKVE